MNTKHSFRKDDPLLLMKLRSINFTLAQLDKVKVWIEDSGEKPVYIYSLPDFFGDTHSIEVI